MMVNIDSDSALTLIAMVIIVAIYARTDGFDALE
jgi:hypothetical protein